MGSRPFLVALVSLTPLLAQSVGENSRLPLRWVTTTQTGLSDTFQMTLGGTFGEGPAWQSKLTTGLANVRRQGDYLFVFGSDSHDVRDHRNDWMAGFGYKAPLWKHKAQALALTGGIQRWLLPHVKSGAKDWLFVGNLAYQTRFGKTGFSAQSEDYSSFISTLPLGHAVYNQVFLHHSLLKHDRINIQLRHGPAHTYSWGLYGANQNRVFRYQSILALSWKDFTLEGGYRKQVGLQDPIVHNNYWHFALVRTFVR